MLSLLFSWGLNGAVHNQAYSAHFSCCELPTFWVLSVISVLWNRDPFRHTTRQHTDREHQGQTTKLCSKTTLLPHRTTSQLPIYKTSHQIISFSFCSGIKRKRLSHPVCMQREKLKTMLLPPNWQDLLEAGWHIKILHEDLSKLILFMLLFSG